MEEVRDQGVDAPYVQPPLAKGLEAVLHLRVAVKQLRGSPTSSLPTRSFISLLHSFHSTDVTTCGIAAQLYGKIEKVHPSRVPLISLDSRRSAYGRWALPPDAEQQIFQKKGFEK